MNLGALALFAFVSSITPGPNNLMLWASGMNFGLARTARHIAGVNVGFSSLLFVTALGLGSLLQNLPWWSRGLQIVGSVYLLYLAYRIATAGRADSRGGAKPFTFFEAVAFQYVNPKAWVIGITAATAFIPVDQPLFATSLVFTLVFAAVNLPCIITWAVAGNAIGQLMVEDRRRRIVNGVLATLLVGTIFLINT